ncbi:hypothetical protein ACQ4M3_20815 [Leptolyngbya sp. AN03gr2]|uniref:hypothetical protein n=1 Tax=unclassified Leptolyngbya TaxID=2650499 RepID=UPI003D31F8E3
MSQPIATISQPRLLEIVISPEQLMSGLTFTLKPSHGLIGFYIKHQNCHFLLEENDVNTHWTSDDLGLPRNSIRTYFTEYPRRTAAQLIRGEKIQICLIDTQSIPHPDFINL